MKTRRDRGRDEASSEDALRRWLEGQDGALDEWLDGRVRRIRRRSRTLATG